jgi:hypothetical protein
VCGHTSWRSSFIVVGLTGSGGRDADCIFSCVSALWHETADMGRTGRCNGRILLIKVFVASFLIFSCGIFINTCTYILLYSCSFNLMLIVVYLLIYVLVCRGLI